MNNFRKIGMIVLLLSFFIIMGNKCTDTVKPDEETGELALDCTKAEKVFDFIAQDVYKFPLIDIPMQSHLEEINGKVRALDKANKAEGISKEEKKNNLATIERLQETASGIIEGWTEDRRAYEAAHVCFGMSNLTFGEGCIKEMKEQENMPSVAAAVYCDRCLAKRKEIDCKKVEDYGSKELIEVTFFDPEPTVPDVFKGFGLDEVITAQYEDKAQEIYDKYKDNLPEIEFREQYDATQYGDPCERLWAYQKDLAGYIKKQEEIEHDIEQLELMIMAQPDTIKNRRDELEKIKDLREKSKDYLHQQQTGEITFEEYKKLDEIWWRPPEEIFEEIDQKQAALDHEVQRIIELRGWKLDNEEKLDELLEEINRLEKRIEAYKKNCDRKEPTEESFDFLPPYEPEDTTPPDEVGEEVDVSEYKITDHIEEDKVWGDPPPDEVEEEEDQDVPDEMDQVISLPPIETSDIDKCGEPAMYGYPVLDPGNLPSGCKPADSRPGWDCYTFEEPFCDPSTRCFCITPPEDMVLE